MHMVNSIALIFNIIKKSTLVKLCREQYVIPLGVLPKGLKLYAILNLK